MFTGIIEDIGVIKKISSKSKNKTFWIESSISKELKIDQSLSHSGVCLTVEEINSNVHRVTAIDETLKKTNLGNWKTGDLVNLERCLQMNGRLDGHIVQGHVDATGICKSRKENGGSWEFSFEFPKKFSHLVIEKGSICLNGISLTAFNVKKKSFSVAIIPYTFEHTDIKNVFPESKANLEFDMIGKYILKNKKDYK
ncbi:MAG TPA: riboflavin synthase [Puia sp.]|jgi:riboflavin synthase|nr:riboflavin synthase [Puia sp.]